MNAQAQVYGREIANREGIKTNSRFSVLRLFAQRRWNFENIDPIKALVYTAVINGVTAVPMLFIIMKIANDKNILGNRVNGRVKNTIGWMTFVIMAIAVVIMFVTFFTKGPITKFVSIYQI